MLHRNFFAVSPSVATIYLQTGIIHEEKDARNKGDGGERPNTLCSLVATAADTTTVAHTRNLNDA